jgi:MOSC domain-containing protein YiiM
MSPKVIPLGGVFRVVPLRRGGLPSDDRVEHSALLSRAGRSGAAVDGGSALTRVRTKTERFRGVVYLAEHYEYWRRELPQMQLLWGMFGENLTAEWLREDALNIGDWFRAGSAEVMVTEPRLPWYKLGIKFGREDIIKRFLASGRTGFYVAVVREGTVEAGDAIELIERNTHGVTVADITRLYAHDRNNRDLLDRDVQVPALSESWRGYFGHGVEKLSAGR